MLFRTLDQDLGPGKYAVTAAWKQLAPRYIREGATWSTQPRFGERGVSLLPMPLRDEEDEAELVATRPHPGSVVYASPITGGSGRAGFTTSGSVSTPARPTPGRNAQSASSPAGAASSARGMGACQATPAGGGAQLVTPQRPHSAAPPRTSASQRRSLHRPRSHRHRRRGSSTDAAHPPLRSPSPMRRRGRLVKTSPRAVQRRLRLHGRDFVGENMARTLAYHPRYRARALHEASRNAQHRALCARQKREELEQRRQRGVEEAARANQVGRH